MSLAAAVPRLLAGAPAMSSPKIGLRRPGGRCFLPSRSIPRSRGLPVVRAFEGGKGEEERQKVQKLEDSLKASGLDRKKAQLALQAWQQATGKSGEVTPEDLRKVLVKQSATFSGLILVQIALDFGAAYGAYSFGSYLGLGAEQYGGLAVALQAVAYFGSGYYLIGAFFDVVKLGMLGVASYQFNVNSASFLAAVQDLAGASNSGLVALDRAVDAVNMVKVLGALNKMADLLKEQQGSSSSPPSMLQDLATYLTLERATKYYGFDAAALGITDKQAAEIATVFSAFDSDEDGVLALDEFQRLCGKFAPELTDPEVKRALEIIDVNGNNKIELSEFVQWWLKNIQQPASTA